MKTEIVYLCWNCGSQTTKNEDIETELPLPRIEKWNVCPECIIEIKAQE